MNQREESAAIVQEILLMIESFAVPLESAVERLLAVVGRAQNSPPEGEGDGSFTADQWRSVRDFANGLSEVTSLLRRKL